MPLRTIAATTQPTEFRLFSMDWGRPNQVSLTGPRRAKVRKRRKRPSDWTVLKTKMLFG
jgi:hypothetical protein